MLKKRKPAPCNCMPLLSIISTKQHSSLAAAPGSSNSAYMCQGQWYNHQSLVTSTVKLRIRCHRVGKQTQLHGQLTNITYHTHCQRPAQQAPSASISGMCSCCWHHDIVLHMMQNPTITLAGALLAAVPGQQDPALHCSWHQARDWAGYCAATASVGTCTCCPAVAVKPAAEACCYCCCCCCCCSVTASGCCVLKPTSSEAKLMGSGNQG
jgi:hypothetical protein